MTGGAVAENARKYSQQWKDAPAPRQSERLEGVSSMPTGAARASRPLFVEEPGAVAADYVL